MTWRLGGWLVEHCRFRQQERAEYALIGPPHPGEVLREVIWPRLNLTRKLAAQRMGIPLSALSNLLNERRRVSRGLAVELARITGTNAVFWLVLQAHYDAWVLENGAVTKKSAAKRAYCHFPIIAAVWRLRDDADGLGGDASCTREARASEEICRQKTVGGVAKW